MKILFITDLYPVNSDEATTSVTLHNFVFEWIKQGHSVTVIKPNFLLNSVLRGKPLYGNDYYEYDGVKIFNVNYFTPFWFNFLNKIPSEIKFVEYDVVIGHMPSGIIFANKMAKTIRKPLVCGVHCSDIEVLTNPIYKIYFKSQLEDAYAKAKKIACRSAVLRKKISNLLPNCAYKTFVATSGVSPEFINKDKVVPFSFKSSPFTNNPPKIKVITCANFKKRKNIDKLILAVNDLADFELNIIGDGPGTDYLKSISLGNVTFLGRLSQERVLEEMRKSNIFVLPSVNESFGMVYLEAMASGCVVVCTKDDGIDGIIKDGKNGFLCEPTSEGIKKTLLKIKEFDKIDKVVKNGLETAQDYSLENCAQIYLEKIQH